MNDTENQKESQTVAEAEDVKESQEDENPKEKQKMNRAEQQAFNLEKRNVYTSETARLAGIKSGQSKRRRKAMKEALNEILSQECQDPVKRELVAKELGIPVENVDNQALILSAMYLKATKGDVQAARWCAEILGEAVQKVEVKTDVAVRSQEIEDFLRSDE